ncbi:ethanolamine ammonia-lyase reactivating factor EutA [Lysinibacillus sp. MHQ-1]|nr:ethanolamine ammonia-lyase reactivating factor EutA [Lysinibacillus sp. MHQ-1]
MQRLLDKPYKQSIRQSQLFASIKLKWRRGDYIDIGEVLPSGVVPVVVKTLAFHSK